ncbi:Gfo/Idh/MocA family protein [Consotaella salsifontis]|uniref:Predicted dehydrogenase n=1 Tax=Consotaella salsifontis TaxID=1365950 RepID=A0A1T4QV66_9HYPH|nr:Gfo/Idh/MocA family oxidoreductase [Consotaella salsifontis]SKA07633.1 Predicted dehydrogenase [Consotaella salsifontis]
MFRWGVISTARIARQQVIPAILESENGVLSAIASRDIEKARALAERFGAPHAFGSYEELLESDVVDGVYIPLPTSQHVEWAKKAAEAGKHVLVEKPLALKASDIEPLIAVRDKAGVLISEAFMVEHHPQWWKVRELIEGGLIGRLAHVQGVFCYHNVDPANMRNKPELGGGGLPDIGVYPTVAARIVTRAEPLKALAKVTRDEVFGTDTYANCQLAFEDFDMSFYVATQLAARQTMVFHGTDGFIEVEAPFNVGLYGYPNVRLEDQKHGRAEVFRFGGINQYCREVEAFAKRAAGEDVIHFTLENSIANQKVIDAFYRSGESGAWESIG